jgi:hypothetical protein
MERNAYRIAFNKALIEHGLTVYFEWDNHFLFIQNGNSAKIVSVQLISSVKINPLIHGSRYGIEIEAVGCFNFYIHKWTDKINYYIFAFYNNTKGVEFVIIPENDLRSRFQLQNRIPLKRKKVELKFWLMPDQSLYDTTNVSAEEEWYYLSKGVNGRMTDGTYLDYVQYLNNWVGLVRNSFNYSNTEPFLKQ